MANVYHSCKINYPSNAFGFFFFFCSKLLFFMTKDNKTFPNDPVNSIQNIHFIDM